MIKRALWTTTATLALLSASSFFVADAFAQKGVVLQPETAWAVTNVGAGTADPYCAIARRFRQNVIVTMAENHKGQASVALDFRDGYFKTGQTYDVTLDPGAGQERSYQMQPISEQAFVVRLGSDQAFFKALSQTGYMRLAVNSQVYNLNLADIEKGRATLDSCLGGLEKPVQAQAPKELESISARLEKLERENNTLRASVSDRQVQEKSDTKNAPSYLLGSASKAKEVAALKAITPRKGGGLDVLVSRLEELETKNAKLERALVKQKTHSSGNEAAEIARLSVENESLQAVLAKTQREAAAAAALTEKLATIEQENEALQLRTAEMSKLRAQMAVLEEDNIALSAEADQLIALKGDMNDEKFAQKLKAQSEKQANLSAKLAKVQSENKELQTSLANNAIDVGALNATNAELSAAQGRLTLLKAHNEDYQAEIAALKDAKIALESKLSENLMLSARLDGDKDSLEALVAEKETKNEALIAELQAELQQSLGRAAQKDQKRIEELAALETENQKLKQQFKDTQAATSDALILQGKINALTVKNDELAQSLDAALTAQLRAEEQLASVQSERDDLVAKVAVVEAEKSDLQQKLAAAKVAQENLELAIVDLRTENTKLSQQLQIARADVGPNNDTVLELQGKLANLQLRNKDLTQELAQQQLAYVELERVVTPMRAESSDLKSELKALNAKFQKMQAQLDQRDAKVDVRSTVSKAASIKPVKRVVQAAVSSIEPAAGAVKAVAKAPVRLAQADIVVNNRAPKSFKNEAKNLERNMVNTIRETELGFEQVDQREAELDVAPVAEQAVTQNVAEEVVQAVVEAVPAPVEEVVAETVPEKVIEPVKAKVAPVKQVAEIEKPPVAAVPPVPQSANSVLSAHEEAVQSTKALLEETGVRSKAPSKEMAFSPPTDVKPKPVVVSKVAPKTAPVAQVKPVVQAAVPAVAPKPTPVAVVPAPAPVPVAPKYYSAPVNLEGVLSAARVDYGGAINRVDNYSSENLVSYQWQGNNGLFGSAQQKPLTASAQFDQFMLTYLEKTEKRCKGDFAIVPSASSIQGVDRIESYEVACIGAGADSAASVLFFSQNGTFSAVAHETPTANMQTAMDVRDQIMKSVSGS